MTEKTNRERAVELMNVIAKITGTYHSEKSIVEIEKALVEAEERGWQRYLIALKESRKCEE